MQTRPLGSLSVSAVGLGCNNFGTRLDPVQSTIVVHAALDAGINFFDTADVYGTGGSEELLGSALGARRSSVIIASKFGAGDGKALPSGASKAAIADAVEGSLRRLNTDWIDLYQLHKPDPSTPISETLEALDELVQQGKVRQIGCSNLSPAQVDEAAGISQQFRLNRFVSAQDELNLLCAENEAGLVASCERHNMAILPYFPLANGMLTGKYSRNSEPAPDTRLGKLPAERRVQEMTEQRFDSVEKLSAFAAQHGHSVTELSFAWLAGVPRLASIIAGASTAEQVHTNAGAIAWALTPNERRAVQHLAGGGAASAQ